MELQQLQEFLTVLESGSLGEAARKLGVAQPNLTKGIQGLERSVGGALFLRTKQGMNPTALGLALETRARVILGEVGRTHRELGELVTGQRGKVVIACGTGFAQAILPGALLRFHQHHPQIEVRVVEAAGPEVVPGVRTSDIDFAIYPLKAVDIRGLASEIFIADEGCLIATNAGNPITAKRRVTLEEIWAGPWILPARPEALRREYDLIFMQAGLPPLQPVFEFTSYPFAKSMLQTGNFIGFFSRLFIQAEIDRKVLKLVNLPEIRTELNLHVIHRMDVPPSAAARILLDEIRKSCTEYRRRH